MNEEIKKVVDDSQQMKIEEKLVSNPLTSEIMEDKDNIGTRTQSDTLIKNNLKNKNMKNTLEKLIEDFNLPSAISTLHEELKQAEEKLEKTKENRKKSVQKKVAKAKKALKEELQKNLLPTPVEEWKYREENGKCIIEKSIKMIILAFAPSLVTPFSNDKLAMDIVNAGLFEKDTTKYLSSADIFYQENIELKDLNGNSIPPHTTNVYYMLGSLKDQRIMQAIYKQNLDALIEGSTLTKITNVQFKIFESMRECSMYISTNVLLDRSLKGKEKINLAALATEDEFMKRIYEVCETENIPVSTAIKYYASGKILAVSSLNDAARGISPQKFEYNLSNGDNIIKTIRELNFGDEIRKRYIIDAFSSFSKMPDETNIPFGYERALKALQAFTNSDVDCIKSINNDKVNLIINRLTSRLKK